MAGKSNALADFILGLLFKGEAPVDNLLVPKDLLSAGALSTFYIALHTADPGDAGTQNLNEPTVAQYPTYARVAVPRATGFQLVTNSGGTSSLRFAAPVTFPATNAAGEAFTCTHVSIGTDASGTSPILYSGPITPSIAFTANTEGIIPQLTTATTIQES